VCIRDESDALIWCYNSSGVYSTRSFYSIINYRGVTHVFIPSIWDISLPPKVQLFLWLLSHKKLATVDNLNKKGLSKPSSCKFCDEEESISHLFFECVVAKAVWSYASQFLGFHIAGDYISVASKWLSKGKIYVVNIIITAAVLSGLWHTRNDFVFNAQVWSVVKLVLRRVLSLSMEWKIIYKMEMIRTGCLSWWRGFENH
jgi:hypothetical protein